MLWVSSFLKRPFINQHWREGAMHAIRGRIGQYKILMQQEQLRPYIVRTERFTKDALLSIWNNANQIILKPIVGTDYIVVTKHYDNFHVKTNIESMEVSEQALYNTLQQHIGERKYVLQQQPTTARLIKKSFRRLITVQKCNGHWQVTASTKLLNHMIEQVAYDMHEARLHKIAVLAAQQLGPYYPHCEAIVIELAFNLTGDIAITDSFLHFSVSKWNQYQRIAKYMPKTDLLTTATFYSFLRRYPLVFLKPCNGQQGKGIIKISRKTILLYEVQFGRQIWIIQGIRQVYEHIRKLVAIDHNYIIQRGIALATIDQRFSDIRVMTQKAKNHWHVTGKVVKVAGPYFFITNAAQVTLPLQQALERSTVFSIFHQKLEQRIDRICLAAAELLDEPIERNIIGFDVAVTNLGQIRILEGNYVPDLSLFRRLEDPSIYNIILDYKHMK